jgi:hypothetical protein
MFTIPILFWFWLFCLLLVWGSLGRTCHPIAKYPNSRNLELYDVAGIKIPIMLKAATTADSTGTNTFPGNERFTYRSVRDDLGEALVS